MSDVIGPSRLCFQFASPTCCGGRQSGRDFRFQSTQDFILMPKARKLTPSAKPSDLFEDIRALIEQARAATARAINSAVTLLYWQVGQRIRRDMLHEQRAEYGEQIVATLSRQLTEEFGRGWNKAALTRMMQFAERFSDPKIVATLSQQLTWSHVVELLPLKDSLQRDFYAEMCRLENWSVRTLRAKIDGMLFERTGLSRKPGELAEQELRALRGLTSSPLEHARGLRPNQSLGPV